MTAEQTAKPALPSPGSYRVDPERSGVSFTGRHMFGLAAVHASFRVASGEVRVTDPLTASTVRLTVDATSFTSDKTRRDAHVRSASLLDAATYPEITFVSSGLREQDGGWLLSGTVTAHGRSVPVEVAVTEVKSEAGEVRVRASTARLDRYAFGVTKVKGMAGRYLDLDFDIVAVPA